jgi:hypothetical protein
MKWLKEIISSGRYLRFNLNIQELEKAIEEKNSNRVLEASKSLIESVCKTILGDLGIKFDNSHDLPKIVKITVDGLPFTKSLNQQDAEKTKTMCGNIITLSKTIGEFRNIYGTLSHGRDIENEEHVEEIISRLIYGSTDIVCSYLIELHTNFSKLKDFKRLDYEDYEDFNSYFDELQETEIIIGALTFKPSKVLFNEDFEAWKEELLEFLASKELKSNKTK